MSFVDHDGASLFYEVEGAGEPLLLITGLGYPSDTWWRVLPWLNERFTTVRLDNRGVGRTGDTAEQPYSIERMAADAVAVMDAAGFTKAHLWGASMGGAIAQELVLTRPERVDRLILACTHAGAADFIIDAEAMALLTSRGEMSAAEAAEASIPFVYAAGTPRSLIDEDIAVRMRIPTTPEGYTAQLLGAAQWRGSGTGLPSIDVPTLVLHGEEDRLVPIANGHFIADRIPAAQFVALPGASHIFWTDQPNRVKVAVLEFLSGPAGSSDLRPG